MDTRSGRPDRTLLAVLVIVAVLIVVALVVVFSRGAPEPLDDATPAGVVQRYTQAVVGGDEAAARSYLTPELQDGCDRVDPGRLDDVRVTLQSTTERGDSADVRVSVVTTSSGGLFGPSEYQSDEIFRLVRVGSGWAIETAPWQLTVCMEEVG